MAEDYNIQNNQPKPLGKYPSLLHSLITDFSTIKTDLRFVSP